MNKPRKAIILFLCLLFIYVLPGCSSQSYTLFDIIESDSIWSTAAEFMEDYNLNLEEDFTAVQEMDTEGRQSTLYEKKEAFPIMGEDSKFVMQITEDNVILIRCFVFSDSAGDSLKFAKKLYEKLVDHYYKPDTSSSLVDRISNHIQLPEDELYQYLFHYQDQWLLPPAFDERTSLLRMEYSYYPETEPENGRYRVMISLSRTLVDVNLNP